MTKNEFLDQLKTRLCDLDENNIERIIKKYSKRIDNNMKELSESEAVESLGEIDEIARHILDKNMFPERAPKPKSNSKTVGLILLVILAPVWLALALAAGILFIALFIAIWAILLSFILVCIALILWGFAVMIRCPEGFNHSFITGLANLGITFIAMGVGLLLSLLFKQLYNFLANLTLSFFKKVSLLFRRREK